MPSIAVAAVSVACIAAISIWSFTRQAPAAIGVGAVIAVLTAVSLATYRNSRLTRRSIDASSAEILSLISHVQDDSARLLARFEKITADARDELIRTRKYMTQVSNRHSRDTFSQIEAILALYVDTEARTGLPPTRGWAASPDLLLYLHGLTMDLHPRLVVECGSGTSTVVLAYALRAIGAGRVIALDHDESYAHQTRTLLKRRDLSDWAEVLFAPLTDVEIDGETYRWYSHSELPSDPIDLLFVDGPPADVQPQARFPAGPLLIDRLSPNGVIVLDDYTRDQEQALSERWLELHPDLVMTTVSHEKGTAIFHRGDRA